MTSGECTPFTSVMSVITTLTIWITTFVAPICEPSEYVAGCEPYDRIHRPLLWLQCQKTSESFENGTCTDGVDVAVAGTAVSKANTFRGSTAPAWPALYRSPVLVYR